MSLTISAILPLDTGVSADALDQRLRILDEKVEHFFIFAPFDQQRRLNEFDWPNQNFSDVDSTSLYSLSRPKVTVINSSLTSRALHATFSELEPCYLFLVPATVQVALRQDFDLATLLTDDFKYGLVRTQEPHGYSKWLISVVNYDPSLSLSSDGLQFSTDEFSSGSPVPAIFFDNSAASLETSAKHIEALLGDSNANRSRLEIALAHDTLRDTSLAYQWYLECYRDKSSSVHDRWFAGMRVAELTDAGENVDSDSTHLYLELFELLPSRAEPLLILAKHFTQQGEYVQAMALIEQALTIDRPIDCGYFKDHCYHSDFEILKLDLLARQQDFESTMDAALHLWRSKAGHSSSAEILQQFERAYVAAYSVLPTNLYTINRFLIVVPFRNAAGFLQACVDSIKQQDYPHYTVCFVDDCSTDEGLEAIDLEGLSDYLVIKNHERAYAMRNRATAIEQHPEWADIAVLLDGDDRLAADDVLSYLNRVYNQTGCWMTYGQYHHSSDGNRGHVRPIASNESLSDLFLKNRFEFPIHLRTLKVGLFKKLLQLDPELNCLRNDKGEFFRHAGDYACNRALMMLAGKSRIRYVEKDLCVYNTSNEESVFRTAKDSQFETIKQVVAMPEFKPLKTIKPFEDSDSSCKVLWVALDGADPAMIDEMLNRGELPNIAKVLSKCSDLVPPQSFGNNFFWQSMYSGKRPGEQSFYDRFMFGRASYQTEESLDARILHSTPAFWTELALNGHQIGLFNAVEHTPVDGPNITFLDDWLVHARKMNTQSSPKSLLEEVNKKYQPEPEIFVGLDSYQIVSADGLATLRDVLLKRQAYKLQVYLDLLKRGSWDLFNCSFDILHDLLHKCWHLLDDQQRLVLSESEEIEVVDVLAEAYSSCDEAIGELIASAPDAIVCVTAGLAMGPNGSRNNDLEKLIAYFQQSRCSEPLPESPIRRVAYQVPFVPNSGALRVNLEGREVEGTVAAADYESTLQALKSFFLELRVTGSETPVATRVVEAAKEFPGPYADRLPDLLIEWHPEALTGGVEWPGHGQIDLSWRRIRSVLDARTGDHVPRAALYGNAKFDQKTHLPPKMASHKIAKVMYDLVSQQ